MNNCKAILSNAGVGIRKRGKYNTRLKWRKNGYEAVISNEYLEQPTRLKAFIEKHNINVITQSDFHAQDSMTNLDKNALISDKNL